MGKFSTDADLRNILSRIDGRGYKAYKEIQGAYDFGQFILYTDHVQGDPFASPSKVRVRVAQDAALIPKGLFGNKIRCVVLQDWLARGIHAAIRRMVRGSRGTGGSGGISIDAGAQEVLERTAVLVTGDWVEARLEVGLPAAGRTVLGRQAVAILCDEIPEIVKSSLFWDRLPQKEGREFVECVENQEHIRRQLEPSGLVAFVADGAILPRESGASDRPHSGAQAVPFKSPDSFRVTIELPNPVRGGERSISGMGIPRGVTLIVGGGYHGKSTLLRALERGVYPHIPGDGREYVVTCADGVKIRAEDGRRIEQVDISPFISDLPYGRSTSAFSTEDASGSTGQAANIIEALEMGATVLLLDEDTSATNFMVRDARMQALVDKKNEPITPFLDRVRELYEKIGVSTVLIMGGCGDYFDVADAVIMMREYLPCDATFEAKEVARNQTTHRRVETLRPFSFGCNRIPKADSFDASRGKREVKIDVKALDSILFGRERIDLRHVEQLVDTSQARAVGYALHLASERFMNGKAMLRDVVEGVNRVLESGGLDALDPFHREECYPGNFARPRKYEIAAAINRLRTVKMVQGKGE